MSRAIDTLIYLDDSAEPRSGLVLFGWISISPASWQEIAMKWLDFRAKLYRDFAVKVDKELHATELVHGRSVISGRVPEAFVKHGVELKKDFGRFIIEECLKEISSLTGLSVHSAYSRGIETTQRLAKESLYLMLVEQWTRELQERHAYAMVFIDGNGTDKMFRKVHREIPRTGRRVIEDSIQLESKYSNLIQIADLVSYAALAAADRAPNNEFAWGWYEKYLSMRDPARSPQEFVLPLKQRDP